MATTRRNKARLYIPSKDRQGKRVSNRKVMVSWSSYEVIAMTLQEKEIGKGEDDSKMICLSQLALPDSSPISWWQRLKRIISKRAQ